MAISLSDFEGPWVLDRRIVHHDAPDAQFHGSARFRAHGTGMVYEEKGLLKVDGQIPVSAQRSYLWRETRGLIEVMFEDGRPFHVIRPDDPQDTHFCDPDTYRLSYQFALWPEWIATCKVNGPKKAYQMVSTYRRPVEGVD